MPRKTETTARKHTTVPPSAKAVASKPIVAAKPTKSQSAAVATVVADAAPPVSKELPDAGNLTAQPGSNVQKSRNATARAAAVTVIGESPDSTAATPLLAALHDPDADAAREAASSLGLLGDVSAVGPLIEVITNADGYFHSVVRSAAAASLAQLKDQRAFDALLNAVYDPIADASSEAIRALAALGDRRAVSTLVEIVRNRGGYFVDSVRRTAVLSLTKLGGEEAQSELRFVSGDGREDSVIREEATAAITAGEG